MRTTIQELAEFGQSIWLDNINRRLIESGKLNELIGLGLRGMTSNPTIFDKAISQSSGYDQAIAKLSGKGKSTFEVYDELTVRDVQEALDLFKGVYEDSEGRDGYVSLEIDPRLADDTAGTIEEGKRLWARVDRPNLMLKVPATEAGFPAVSELLSGGMNVNVTLIFSLKQYQKAQAAFIKGAPREKVASVASVFVSRIDTMIDKMLDEKDALELKGKAAVANSELIYRQYLNTPEAHRQRALWASTSTKNPAYSDIKYVAELIGKGTVNTLPDKTLENFLDHGAVEEALTGDIAAARDIISQLKNLGIDIDEVCAQLLETGVEAFVDSFNSLLTSIRNK